MKQRQQRPEPNFEIYRDIAADTAQLTRTAILQQIGSSVLAQANIQPQLALRLLQ